MAEPSPEAGEGDLIDFGEAGAPATSSNAAALPADLLSTDVPGESMAPPTAPAAAPQPSPKEPVDVPAAPTIPTPAAVAREAPAVAGPLPVVAKADGAAGADALPEAVRGLLPAGKAAQDAIFCILVVGFHHTLGNHVEYAYPPLDYVDPDPKPPKPNAASAVAIPPQWRFLPFIAIPDGVHTQEEDHVFFFTPSLEAPPTTLYGCAYFKQMESKDLVARTSDVTRTHVQKSLVVLSRLPFYNAICERLAPATRVFFEQRDFSNKEIVRELYLSLNAPGSLQTLEPAALTAGLPARALVQKFGKHTLTLFKALLLERRVLLYGLPVSTLGRLLLALLSLFPAFLERYVVSTPPSAPSALSPYFCRAEFGLPLEIFHGGRCEGELAGEAQEGKTAAVLAPFLSLEQTDTLQESNVHGFLCGTSNLLCAMRPHAKLDVLARTDDGKVDVRNEALAKKALALTASDRQFMRNILQVVGRPAPGAAPPVVGGSAVHPSPSPPLSTAAPAETAAGPASASSQGEGTTWVGSDGWIRAQFESYLEGFLAAVAAVPGVLPPAPAPGTATPAAARPPPQPLSGDAIAELDVRPAAGYGTEFARAWLATHNAHRWRARCTPGVAVLRPPVVESGPRIPTGILEAATGMRERVASAVASAAARLTGPDEDERVPQAPIRPRSEGGDTWELVDGAELPSPARRLQAAGSRHEAPARVGVGVGVGAAAAVGGALQSLGASLQKNVAPKAKGLAGFGASLFSKVKEGAARIDARRRELMSEMEKNATDFMEAHSPQKRVQRRSPFPGPLAPQPMPGPLASGPMASSLLGPEAAGDEGGDGLDDDDDFEDVAPPAALSHPLEQAPSAPAGGAARASDDEWDD